MMKFLEIDVIKLVYVFCGVFVVLYVDGVVLF